jgi:hypothetical protein
MLSRVLPLAAALCAAAAASGAVPSAERQVLLNLYSSTGGSAWTRRTGWNGAPGTECSWYGIACDAAGSHVTGIDLDGDNLSGTLPPLSGLSSLLYLILPNNHLTGTIPAVSSLTGLRILELYANGLTGSIPSLAGLSSLTSLELNSNQLTGTIPDLSSLTSLQIFDLDTNGLTGPVPSLSAMTHLQYMALDTNALSGTFPALSALTQLADCELYDNRFTGPVPGLSGLSNLSILLLSNNRFSGAFPDITGVPLETLDLNYNLLSGPVPSSVGNATTLLHLDCAGNDLTGALPSTLSNLTKLESGGSDFGYNGLFTSNASLASFLDGKQQGGDWRSTQTIAPAGVASGSATNNAVRLSWNPIAYTADAGSYGIYLSPTSGGPYTLRVTTPDKTVSSAIVSGLKPSTTYYAVVRATTNANPNNASAITSGNSAQVAFSTTSCGGCALSPTGLLIEGVSPYPPKTTEPNGVLEPGETALVSPVWTDTSAGAVAGVQGTAGAASGPTNGTTVYSLPKTAATYGDFPAGGARSCGSDCYQIRVTADIRPASHWDATFTESLNSGETHTWTLHLGASFADVPSSSGFYADIETIFHHGITTGTTPGTYSPLGQTQRNQMAAFISRAHAGGDQYLPASGTVPGRGSYSCVAGGSSLFSDVAPTDLFCKNLHYVVALGLSFGCTDGTQFVSTFCPSSPITRRSMSVMLARDLAGGDSQVPVKMPDPGNGRGYDCSDGQPNAFDDVPDSDPSCRHIYYLWSKSIVDGFGDGSYGPDDPVLRSQMAKYLTNSYRLQLYPPD